ncbi:MAG: AlpA family phage regulatory protein [Lysobacteraceae bacterium]|jgi:prophage regulatory protein
MTSQVRLLPLREVRRIVGLSPATIYRQIAAGDFPAPCKQGTRSLWVSTEIDAWIAAVITARNMGRDMGQSKSA